MLDGLRRSMDERLSPREYVGALRALRESITDATSRAEALQCEEKPLELARDLDLDQLVSLLEGAEERALEAVTAAEILAATGGMGLEEQ
jgi:hypothetical protein